MIRLQLFFLFFPGKQAPCFPWLTSCQNTPPTTAFRQNSFKITKIMTSNFKTFWNPLTCFYHRESCNGCSRTLWTFGIIWKKEWGKVIRDKKTLCLPLAALISQSVANWGSKRGSQARDEEFGLWPIDPGFESRYK